MMQERERNITPLKRFAMGMGYGDALNNEIVPYFCFHAIQ